MSERGGRREEGWASIEEEGGSRLQFIERSAIETLVTCAARWSCERNTRSQGSGFESGTPNEINVRILDRMYDLNEDIIDFSFVSPIYRMDTPHWPPNLRTGFLPVPRGHIADIMLKWFVTTSKSTEIWHLDPLDKIGLLGWPMEKT